MVRQRHDPRKNLVGFVVGDVHYAVPIGVVREISNPLEVVALPHASREIVGVADVRGEVVPVVDLRTRFGISPSTEARRSKWIVLRVSGRLCAFVVDAVTEVFGSSEPELRQAPALGGGENVRGIRGVTNRGDVLVFVLDPLLVAESAIEAGVKGQIQGPANPLLGKGVP